MESAFFTVAAGVADPAQAVWLDDLQIDGSGGATNNRPPTISKLTADPATITGTSTVLRATAADADDDLLSYQWRSVQTPAGATVQFSGSGATSTATFDQAGAYRLAVDVTDGRGGTASTTVDIQVRQTASEVLVAP